MKLFSAFILLIISWQASASNIDDRIKELGLVESQRDGVYGWYEAGFRSFYVSRKNNEILIREPPLDREPVFPPKFEAKNGTFVGTDNGEWGGELHFENKQKRKEIILSKNKLNFQNVMSLVPNGNGLLVFSGSLHMGSSGSLYSIDNIDKPRKVRFVTLLPDAPIEVLIFKNEDWSSLISIGVNTIAEISPGYGIQAFNPWKGMHPTSAIQVDENTILVGLQSGLATVDTSERIFKVKVYVPPEHKL
jgi:hypothetical protein